ncbi:MAG: Gfo/Idh/MocA family oxidoreductase [Pseudomonadota bacterium]
MGHMRWGILGASNFAREQMGPAIHAAEHAELVALATSHPAKAAGFTAFAPGLRVHESYEALLSDGDVDAIYVPLPNHLHVEWAVKALNAGKHVLVEKPLGLNVADFEPVIAARDATGRLAAEAYMIVHHPQIQRARALVQGGVIGRLRHVEAVFTYDNSDDPGNVRNAAAFGGGGLPDIGVYIFGATRYVTGAEPEAILSTTIEREAGVDTFAHTTARFAPGFTYSGLVSMRMQVRQEMTFHGEGGSLRLKTPFNPRNLDQAELHLMTDAHSLRIERWTAVNQYVLQVEAFGRAARGEEAFACPLEFSRGTQAMIDMVLEAEQAGL